MSDHVEIIGYLDSDYAECQDSRRSTSCFIYKLARGAISCKSAKQIFITSSTMTFEFVACYETSNHGLWLQNFVIGLHILSSIEK